MPLHQKKEPGVLKKKESQLRAAFLYQVSNIPGGEKIKRCIQCGTCTGSCPVSYTMDIPPREIIALFRAGDIESILASRTIWICASCYACTVRCPMGIKVTDILYALKRMAMEENLFPKRFPVYVLSRSFVKMANLFGRSYEIGLLVAFYLRTKPWRLFSLLPLGYRLWRRGRVGLFPLRVKQRRQLAEILREAEIMEMIVPVSAVPLPSSHALKQRKLSG